MARRRAAVKREVIPDPRYGRIEVAKFINMLMQHGKKGAAEKITYSAFDEIAKKSKEDPVKIFLAAIENVRPAVEVKSRRVGGATYQVPVEVSAVRGFALACRWIIEAAANRGEKTMWQRLLAEIMEAAQGRGSAVKKRDETHRMADANKAFAHFRW
ncbi:MAG: 30S ribosomal protein S7 [Dongiaceae bacterium]